MFKYNDGGRKDAGFKGAAGDCGARALAIAKSMEYKTAYNLIATENKNFGYAKSARDGVHKNVYNHVLEQLGMKWHTAPKFTGKKAKCSDMPDGVVIARQAHHYVAVINGVPQDTWDCSNKMVYGYWK